MRKRLAGLVSFVSMIMLCVASQAATPSSIHRQIGTFHGRPVVVGSLTRSEIERIVPGWVKAEVEVRPVVAAAHKLASVGKGARVTVYFGTWCPDSRREVSRLWRTLDEVGDNVPFTIRYFGIDHGLHRPANIVKRAHLVRVPTFVVERDGRELGRIVEVSPHGIENDLLALLTGKEHGLVTGSEDLLHSRNTVGARH